MKQSLHIFAKDAKHLWIEISLSLLVTVAFVVLYPHTWRPVQAALSGAENPLLHQQLDKLAQALVGLVPVSWWLLIARSVHGESLVGRRQFWITRPYRWPALLGAKLLFIAVFILVPFFVAESLLLAEAGFDPRDYLAGLTFNLAMVTGILILPLIAAAAVTSNFGWMALWLTGLTAYIGGVALVYSWLRILDVSTPSSDPYSFPALVLVMVCVIVLQYARRRAWLAHGLLASVAVTIGVTVFFMPTQEMVDAAYPQASGGSELPMQVGIVNDSDHPIKIQPGESDREVMLQIPLISAGVVKGRAVSLDDAMVVLEGDNGKIVRLQWRSTYNLRYLPGEEYDSTIAIRVKRSLLAPLRGQSVRLTLGLAMTELEAEKAVTLPLSAGEMIVPGFGICSEGTWGPWTANAEAGCRFAMNPPRLTYVRVTVDADACHVPAPKGRDGVLGGWVGGIDPGLAEMGITSVWTSGISLQNSENRYSRPDCSHGTVSFTPYHVRRRMRAGMVVPAIRLPEEEKSETRLLLSR